MPTERVQAGWIRLDGELVPLQSGVVAEGLVSEQGYDVIVGLIQSNIRGAATDYDAVADQYASPSINMWNWSSGTIVSATEPLSTRDSGTGMGAMNTFVKDYAAERLAAGRKILIVNTARGGTGFTLPSTNPQGTGFHWDRTLVADANNLAYSTVTMLNSLMASLPSGSRIVAFLANHGSTDGTNNTPKATFKAALVDWIAWLRTQTNTTNVPYVMMQMRPSLRIETRHRNIDDAQQEVAAEGASAHIRYAYAPDGAEYNRADSVHFNALGVREIGHRLFTAWKN